MKTFVFSDQNSRDKEAADVFIALVPNLQKETLKPEKAQPTDKTYFQTE